ncbi:MAG: chemotaxis protein CheC [Candidatus Bathyarchaeota archaeon]|nr:chemotaxis protein CheC [Candidatus Bathyarchaeum tardum]WGM90034.1 MAG: chemotaxis protein CheC [Candidatus Bathyarchaeum tardum]WNZ29824.1 MAG: chemotaxis protein CheC [Candidatus Bathyarchaeota archaeon]
MIEKAMQKSNDLDLEIFLELGSIGAGNAATSLSEIFQEQISIEVPKIHAVPNERVQDFYEQQGVESTGIYMQLRGDADCDVLLIFENKEAKKIASMMTMMPIEELDPEMETSAIEELGNIVIGSFLAALSDFTSVNLVPYPPERTTDSFERIFEKFTGKQLVNSDVAIIFDTHFKRSDGNISGVLMMFPSEEMHKALTDKAKDWV